MAKSEAYKLGEENRENRSRLGTLALAFGVFSRNLQGVRKRAFSSGERAAEKRDRANTKTAHESMHTSYAKTIFDQYGEIYNPGESSTDPEFQRPKNISGDFQYLSDPRELDIQAQGIGKIFEELDRESSTDISQNFAKEEIGVRKSRETAKNPAQKELSGEGSSKTTKNPTPEKLKEENAKLSDKERIAGSIFTSVVRAFAKTLEKASQKSKSWDSFSGAKNPQEEIKQENSKLKIGFEKVAKNFARVKGGFNRAKQKLKDTPKEIRETTQGLSDKLSSLKSGLGKLKIRLKQKFFGKNKEKKTPNPIAGNPKVQNLQNGVYTGR